MRLRIASNRQQKFQLVIAVISATSGRLRPSQSRLLSGQKIKGIQEQSFQKCNSAIYNFLAHCEGIVEHFKFDDLAFDEWPKSCEDFPISERMHFIRSAEGGSIWLDAQLHK